MVTPLNCGVGIPLDSTLDLKLIFGSRPLKVEGVIGGRGESVLEGATLRVKIPEKLDFIWVKL